MNLSKYNTCFKEVFGVKEDILNEYFKFGTENLSYYLLFFNKLSLLHFVDI